jgi:hypothetical protein
MAWTDRPARVTTALEPMSELPLGRPVFLTIVARDAGRDTSARLTSVTLRRGAAAIGGGACPDGPTAEAYCPP